MKMLKVPIWLATVLFCGLFTPLSNAADRSPSKGVGPIKEVKLGDLSVELATKGKVTFAEKCSACHKVTERYVGPNLGDVFNRRQPEWIMNMMLNPVEMTQKDEDAKALFEEYLVQMTFQNVDQDQARAILEYFRYYSEKGEIADAKKSTKPSKIKK